MTMTMTATPSRDLRRTRQSAPSGTLRVTRQLGEMRGAQQKLFDITRPRRQHPRRHRRQGGNHRGGDARAVGARHLRGAHPPGVSMTAGGRKKLGLPKGPSERVIQSAVIEYITIVAGYRVIHFPAGGIDPQWRGMMARSGTPPGVPDLLIFRPARASNSRPPSRARRAASRSGLWRSRDPAANYHPRRSGGRIGARRTTRHGRWSPVSMTPRPRCRSGGGANRPRRATISTH